MRRIRIAAWFAVIAVVAALATWLTVGSLAPAPPGESASGGSGSVLIGGPFELVDGTGRTVTDHTYRGKFLLVYFGYTFCPDVCPTGLAAIGATLDELGDAAALVQPLFITVDPARDTPAALADYVAQFHPRIVGLTGTDAQVAAAAKAYRVYFRKAPTVGGSEDDPYLVDHSAYTYLMGPVGRYRAVFTHNSVPEEMARTITRHLHHSQ